jgi:hypothetical protein
MRRFKNGWQAILALFEPFTLLDTMPGFLVATFQVLKSKLSFLIRVESRTRALLFCVGWTCKLCGLTSSIRQTNKVLIKSSTHIKVVPIVGICNNLVSDNIKLVGFDSIEQMANL